MLAGRCSCELSGRKLRRSFSAIQARDRILPAVRLDDHRDIFSCSESSWSGEDRGGSNRCGVLWLKKRERHAQETHPGVLRLRAGKTLFMRLILERFAQDEGLVGD